MPTVSGWILTKIGGGRQDVVGPSKKFPRNIPWQLRDHDPMSCSMKFVLTFYIILEEKRFLFLLVGGGKWQNITWLDMEMRVLNKGSLDTAGSEIKKRLPTEGGRLVYLDVGGNT